MILLAVIIAAAVLVAVFLVWACACIDSGVWVKAVCRDLEPGKILFTFDDGPDPETTPQILDILSRHGLKAYFFIVGEKAEKYPWLVRRIAEEGHVIGNHTYTHSVLFPLSGKPCIEDDIRACDSVTDAALEGRAGAVRSRERLFRPPFGVTNPDIAKVLKHTGHKVVGWDVRSFDTLYIKDTLSAGRAEAAVKKCTERVVRKARPGSVILLHDRLHLAPELLSSLITALK